MAISTCDHCHEPITQHEDIDEVIESDGTHHAYHSRCFDVMPEEDASKDEG